MAEVPFYHDKTEDESIVLTQQEERDRDQDWEDIKNQREYRNKRAKLWKWAGTVYNIVQEAELDDRVANIAIGWVRSYIDTGISQMTDGEPSFDFSALGPSDEAREQLWKKLVDTTLERSNYISQQQIAITDSHVFGPGVFEVYQQLPYRTIRVPKEGGTYEEKVVRDFRRPKVGVRAISPFRVTRNPSVSDPNEVGSCTKEEKLTWNQFVQNYARVYLPSGNPKFKNCTQVPRGSHVKITHYYDEIRDVYRIYALSYGNAVDGESDIPPEELGIPIFDRPLKIHDVKDEKGEILRSLGLNIPGMCPLVFLPYSDKLDDDYETHSLYGMGLPEHMEGLDTMMQTFFNMTVDNFRMGNTVIIGAESRDGNTPDFDANQYYGGEFVNADITATPLGQDRTGNFDQMYDVIQKLTIPGTGINVSQITGDTSKTAFEFSQRIQANNQRSRRRLREWESGPLKRLGNLVLSAAISELTVHDLEQLTEKDAEKALKDIGAGRATRQDFVFENGKPSHRKVRFFIDMKGMKEDVSRSSSGTRVLDVDSVENTLVPDLENPDKTHKIPLDRTYVYPDWYVESGMLFDVAVDSKGMMADKNIRDVQTLQATMNIALQLMQIDPEFAQSVQIDKIFKKILGYADLEEDEILDSKEGDEIDRLLEKVQAVKDSIDTPQEDVLSTEAGQVDLGPIAAQPTGQSGTQDTLQGAADGSV